ncbi:MAG: signal peptidase I [Firmicutes bacterium]|nr:signal peptidase I [Bacillota bacterium]
MVENKKEEQQIRPSLEQLEGQLKKERYKVRYQYALRTTVYTLLAVAAAAILVATLWMPVLQIYGSSMVPTLNEGEVVVSWKGGKFEQGDVVAFYYNNKLLVKRVIAGPGSWVDIKDDGTVYVDGELLEEEYIKEKALGECNIDMPYQVPDERYFVMGDHRATSVDSRNTAIGCVAKEDIAGKLVFRIWPLGTISKI